MRHLLFVLALAAPITASADEYRTVEWFRDHADARHQTVLWCRNNAGLAMHNPNCRNAQDGSLLAEERAMAAASNSLTNWRPPGPYEPVMLNSCRVLREKGIQATRNVAANCHDAGAPGY